MEMIKKIREEILSLIKEWARANIDERNEKIREIMLKIQPLLEILIKKGFVLDFNASQVILDLLNNIASGLQYEDDVLLLDTLQYGWIPYLDLIIDHAIGEE